MLRKILPFTHAWIPKNNFDEVIEKDGWVCARYQDGYLALFSQNKYYWQTEGEDEDKEIIVDGRQNIWIMENISWENLA